MHEKGHTSFFQSLEAEQINKKMMDNLSTFVERLRGAGIKVTMIHNDEIIVDIPPDKDAVFHEILEMYEKDTALRDA